MGCGQNMCLIDRIPRGVPGISRVIAVRHGGLEVKGRMKGEEGPGRSSAWFKQESELRIRFDGRISSRSSKDRACELLQVRCVRWYR